MVQENKNGLHLTLDSYKLSYIKSYQETWTNEYDEAFTTWDFRTIRNYCGRRLSVSVATSNMPAEEADRLISVLTRSSITFTSPNGYKTEMTVDGVPKTVSALLPNGYGLAKRGTGTPLVSNPAAPQQLVTVSFNLTAVGLDRANGGL